MLLQADTQWGLGTVLQSGFVGRAVLAIVVLLALAWAAISTWDNAMGNVLFGILVSSAGVVALLLALVTASALVR